MTGSLLGERYAKALYDLAAEKKVVDEVYGDLHRLASLIRESRDLRLFLRSPVISPGKKQKVIRILTGDRGNPLTLSFILLLVRKRREAHIPDIAFEFIELFKERHGILTVTVKSPVRVTEEIRKQIVETMKKYSDARIDIVEEIDESLIGGFVLCWKDKQYDASIRNQINRMTRGVARINLYVKEL
jgi:F-type H+-transporting ATPase subunit delta